MPIAMPGGDQRRAAVADEGQRHALGRQQPHRDAHVDHRLHPEDAGQPGAGEPDEGIALVHQPQQRAHGHERVEQDDHEHQDQPVFLGRDGDDEVGMRVGQDHFTSPSPTPTPKNPPSRMALVA